MGPVVAVSAALMCLAAQAAGAVPPSPQEPFVERPDSDLLLLALRLNREILADTLEAYIAPGGLMVPLGEISRLLELPIRVDVSRGVAEGSFLDEKRLLHVDARARRAVVEGRALAVEPGHVEVHADDIYVHTSSLSAWLPLNLDVDLQSATLTVRPREPLPLEQRKERQQRAEKALAGLRPPGRDYPLLALPHRFLDGPFLDLNVRASGQPEGEEARFGGQYAAFLTADLLFMESSLRLSGSDQEGIETARGSLARRDARGGLLGPLHAREFAVGEVFHPGLDLLALPSTGPGALLTNFPLLRQTEFDQHSFRGELPPGWEVELYRNDDLIGYQQARADGRYEFVDVPLLFGLNVFRLVFHGPQGQQRSETRRFNVGESLTPAGRLYYRFVANRPEDGGERASGELDIGFGGRLSLNLAVAQVELPEDGPRRYGRAGLRGYWGWLFAHADYAHDRAGGSVAQAGLQTRLGPLGVSLRHASLDGFRSERFAPQFGPVRSRSSLRLDGAIPPTFLPRLPFTLDASREALETGGEHTRLSQRLSMFHRRLALSNQLNWTMTEDGAGLRQSQATGDLLLSRFMRRFAARGEIQYNLRPRRELAAMALTGEARPWTGYLLAATVSRVVLARQTRYGVGIQKNAGDFGFGVKADYAQRGGWTLALSMDLGLSRDGGRWHADARSVAPSGAVSARAFLDADDDGRFDPNERLLPDVGFALNGASLPGLSGKDGRLFAAHLPTHQDAAVSITLGTLEDPLWGVRRPGVRIAPRPGRVARIDFPVVVQGEIVGTVYESDGRSTRERGGIDLELADARGQVLKRTTSAYDGFFDLTGLAPGRYQLRVAGDRVAGRHLVPPPPKDLVMEPGGTILEGVDFVLSSPSLASGAADVPFAAARVSEPGRVTAPDAPAQLAPGQSPRGETHPDAGSPPANAATGAKPSALPSRPSGIRSPPGHAVQVASFQDPAIAAQEAARVSTASGRRAYVRPVDLGARGVWHRVLVGGFGTAAEAQAYGRRLRPEASLPASRPGAGPQDPGGDAIVRSQGRTLPMRSREWRGAPTYALQLASFPDRMAADREAARFAALLDAPVRVMSADLGTRGVWHRILAVGFRTPDDAYRYRDALPAGSEPGPVYRLESRR